MNANKGAEVMNEIVGRSMSSVEFVHDYIQFRFDGPCLTTLTIPSIKTDKGLVRAADRRYRDCLCSQIGVCVLAVKVTDEELIVEFASEVAFVVSLRDVDYTGPEAINYIAEDGRWVVV
jgi:hypothetical protein